MFFKYQNLGNFKTRVERTAEIMSYSTSSSKSSMNLVSPPRERNKLRRTQSITMAYLQGCPILSENGIPLVYVSFEFVNFKTVYLRIRILKKVFSRSQIKHTQKKKM